MVTGPCACLVFSVRSPRLACPFCGNASTHVIRWPRVRADIEDGQQEIRARRQHYCRTCAARVTAHQATMGLDRPAYRFRVIQ